MLSPNSLGNTIICAIDSGKGWEFALDKQYDGKVYDRKVVWKIVSIVESSITLDGAELSDG